jgi:Zn-dependent protease with chaperone function
VNAHLSPALPQDRREVPTATVNWAARTVVEGLIWLFSWHLDAFPLPDRMAAFEFRGFRRKADALFRTHPPLEERITSLESAT